MTPDFEICQKVRIVSGPGAGEEGVVTKIERGHGNPYQVRSAKFTDVFYAAHELRRVDG